jgi:DNA repair protein RadD
LPVEEIQFSEHFKLNKPPSLRIDFFTPSMSVSEWLAFEHSPGARYYAEQKWRRLGGRLPIPRTVSEALARQHEVPVIAEIGVRRENQYWRFVALRH